MHPDWKKERKRLKKGVLTINFLFYTNFAVFSVFAVLLITELMGSVLLLIGWNKYKGPVLEYIIPVWEVTGTFGAFWVVTSDFAYPSILIPLASIFSAGIMIFLILFVFRNATISYAEFIKKRGWLDDHKLYAGYSISSILMGLTVLVIISGIIGGNGINLKTMTFSAWTWLLNPSGVVFIIGALLLMIGLAPVFYNDSNLRRASIVFVVLGLIVSNISLAMFRNWTLSYYVIIPDVLALLVPILYNIDFTRKIVSNKIAFIALASIDVFFLNFMVYPAAFGGALSVDALTNSGPLASSYVVITILGTIMLAVLVALYAIAVARKSSQQKKEDLKTKGPAGSS